MRQSPEFFGEQEMDLLYVAKKLNESLQLEEILDEQGLDYLVEPDQYKGGVIFPTTRIGAFFYVLPDVAEQARSVLAGAGYKPYQTE
jgi:hypothetical protein